MGPINPCLLTIGLHAQFSYTTGPLYRGSPQNIVFSLKHRSPIAEFDGKDTVSF